MLAGMTSRVVASADSIDNTSLIVINDEATYFIKREQKHRRRWHDRSPTPSVQL